MLRVGLIGLGPWGQRILEKLIALESFEVVAVHDPSGPSSPSPVPVCTRITEFWESVPMDAVVVAVSPRVQGKLGVEALRRGFPLFIEKPMALSLDTAEQIVALSRAHGLIVHVNHLVRYDALHRRALEEIRGGELGELLGSVHVRTGARLRPHVSAHSVLLPHDLSLVHGAFGQDGRWDAAFAPRETVLGRRMSASGVASTVWAGIGAGVRRQTLYVGSRRTIGIMEGQLLRIARSFKQTRAIERALGVTELEGFLEGFFQTAVVREVRASGDSLALSLMDFARAVRDGRSTCCDALDGAHVTRALLAIDAAAESSRSLSIENF